MSVLLGAEWAVTKHTGLYFESGDSTAKNTGILLGFTKVGLQIWCSQGFFLFVFLKSLQGTSLLDLPLGGSSLLWKGTLGR